MKIVRLLVIGLLCVALLFATACGSDSAIKNEQGTNSSSVTQPYKGQKISALYMSGLYADAAKSVVPEFEKLTGAKVEILDFPYATLHDKMLLDLTSKSASYDVLATPSQWDGEFAPYVEPLEKYITKSNFDINDFIPNVLDNSGRWQGKMIGIPTDSTPYAMTYRTDLVKTLPKTWDEYLAIAKQYTDPSKGMYGISTPASKTQFGSLYIIRLWSMGGDWSDANWNVTINSPEARKAMQSCKDMLQYCDPAALSWGIAEANNAFLQGNAVFCESWATLGILQDADNPQKSKIVGKWALAPFPAEKTGLTNVAAHDLQINGSSKYKDLAWEWIKFATSSETQYKFYKQSLIPAPRASFWEREDVKNVPYGKMRSLLDKAVLWWRIPASNEAKTELGNAVGDFMAGNKDIESAIKYAEDAMKNALKKNPPPAGATYGTADIIKGLSK